MILYLRGHVRNSFNNNNLYYLLKYINRVMPNIKIYIQTWNIIQSNISWREMNEIDYTVTNELIFNYFRDLSKNIKEIIILDDKKIELIGDLSGNICDTKAPKKGWKNMWYGICEGLKNIKRNFHNELVINTRFDILSNSVSLNEQYILYFIKNNMNYSEKKMKVYNLNGCFGIDNIFIGNIDNMLVFIEYFYTNLDEILKKYPIILHQELIFFNENNIYEYNTISNSENADENVIIKWNNSNNVKFDFLSKIYIPTIRNSEDSSVLNKSIDDTKINNNNKNKNKKYYNFLIMNSFTNEWERFFRKNIPVKPGPP